MSNFFLRSKQPFKAVHIHFASLIISSLTIEKKFSLYIIPLMYLAGRKIFHKEFVDHFMLLRYTLVFYQHSHVSCWLSKVTCSSHLEILDNFCKECSYHSCGGFCRYSLLTNSVLFFCVIKTTFDFLPQFINMFPHVVIF